MDIVYISEKYTNFLRENGDPRVSYNKEDAYHRPYLGVLFIVNKSLFFAPLTSSNKGKKLKDNPKKENLTFFPLDDCRLGGINLNNMIPVVEGVYKSVDYEIFPKDSERVKTRKEKLNAQKKIVDENEKHIRRKARILYNLKTSGLLYENYDKITCDFLKLEKVASLYVVSKK
jgi:protein AbiQ